MRDALVAAAFQLFLERGYEQTTVDDIVALAGVGRRSFFRYFPSKEDVVFPDHERCLADMTAFLATGDDTDEPVRRVCDAARLVLGMYAENPTFSVQRYRLTKKVPGLRAYELSVVWRYERALAHYPGCARTGRTTRASRWTTHWGTCSPPSAPPPHLPSPNGPRTSWSSSPGAELRCGGSSRRSSPRSAATDPRRADRRTYWGYGVPLRVTLSAIPCGRARWHGEPGTCVHG
jgi:AcrR family transcriptional regulator